MLQQSGQIKDDDSDLVDFLLKNISDDLFNQFIRHIKLNAFSEELIKKITLYILNYSSSNVKNKVFEISRRDVIANSRNKTAAFFKGVFGALLSLPLFCAPLFVEKYRDFFFESRTVSSLKYLNETTWDNGPKHNLTMRNRIQ